MIGRRLHLRLYSPQSNEASADLRRRAVKASRLRRAQSGGRSDTHRQITGVQLHFLLQLREELVVEGLQLVREEQRSKVKPRKSFFFVHFLDINGPSDRFTVDTLALHRS